MTKQQKVHFADQYAKEFKTPWCSHNVRMIGKPFLESEDKAQVTCKSCLMSLGIIPEKRGNKQ